MKTIKDIDISGKRVFIRVDFNVPLDEYIRRYRQGQTGAHAEPKWRVLDPEEL